MFLHVVNCCNKKLQGINLYPAVIIIVFFFLLEIYDKVGVICLKLLCELLIARRREMATIIHSFPVRVDLIIG